MVIIYRINTFLDQFGLTIAARKYNFGLSAPFQTSDIFNLQPVVKHSVPMCSEARDLMDTGKARLSEGMLNEAYTHFAEAFSVLQQVTGPMHREVANCCRYLAMVLYHAGDMQRAILQQNKELIINERCLGLDHPDTAHRQMRRSKKGSQRPQLLPRRLSIFLRQQQQEKNPSTSSANKSISSALIGEPPLPRRRGVDERAAKAAAEVRKKAAAKGLLLRPTGGVPVQPLTPLAQLLKIINLGTHTVDGRASNDSTPNVGTCGPTDTNGSETPFGLGTGLASLDSKKQKSKPKPAS